MNLSVNMTTILVTVSVRHTQVILLVASSESLRKKSAKRMGHMKQSTISSVTFAICSPIFTARCYASAVLAMGLCLSVCHKSEFF